MNKSDPDIDPLVLEKVIESTSAHSILNMKKIQDLWKNYGGLYRIQLNNTTCILKYISPPDEDTVSFQRKMKSYIIEQTWYKDYRSSKDDFYSPKFIDAGIINNHNYLILEDLQTIKYFPKTKLEWNDILGTIKWIANLHASNINNPASGLWEKGSYWNISTRLNEYNNLPSSPIKENAYQIDKMLENSKFSTIIHGDAKLVNFLYAKDLVAAVDFQYVGKGVGIKDIVSFLSSIFSENDLYQNETKILNFYFNTLNEALIKNNSTVDFTALEKEYRNLYPLAWADLYRFLMGWDSKHWKINKYMKEMSTKAIEWI